MVIVYKVMVFGGVVGCDFVYIYWNDGCICFICDQIED